MGDVIECPKHNGRFDYRTGAALGAPVLVGLRTYPTRVVAGTVEIAIETGGGTESDIETGTQ